MALENVAALVEPEVGISRMEIQARAFLHARTQIFEQAVEGRVAVAGRSVGNLVVAA